MKRIFMFFFASVLLCAVLLPAQEAPDRYAFAGATYQDGSQVKGLAGFAVRLGDTNAYNFTESAIGMAPAGFGNISIAGKDLQADISSGIGYDVFAYKGFHLLAIADAGLQQTGDSSSALFKTGGGLYKTLYKDLGLIVFGRWKYAENPKTLVYQWNVSPSFVLTYKF